MIARSIALLALLSFSATSADALTMKECSAKYKSAQKAGSLNNQKWNDFRKAECGPDAAATPASTPTATASKPAPTQAAAPAAPTATGNAVFPNGVDAKYSKESAGKARMHTCLDQYNVNKSNNGNGALKWISEGRRLLQRV